MTVVVTSGRRVSIGRVLGRALRAILDAPAATLGIAFLSGALPGALVNYLLGMLHLDGFPQANVTVATVFGSLVGFACWMLAQGAVIHATVTQSQCVRPAFGACIRVGLRTTPLLLVLAAIVGIAVFAGLAIFFLPGVLLLVLWSVAAPAMVEERRGVLGSLGRSRALTKGARWTVFATFLLVTVIWWIATVLVGVSGVLASGGGLRYATDDGTVALPFLAMSTVVQAITATFWATIQASLFVELREWKDGPATDALAEVFA